VDPAILNVDFRDLVKGPGVNVSLFPEFFRCDGDEGLQVVDDTADIVRDASGRVRGVWTALEDDDCQILSVAAGLRGRAHSSRIPSDDDKPLLVHVFPLPSGFSFRACRPIGSLFYRGLIFIINQNSIDEPGMTPYIISSEWLFMTVGRPLSCLRWTRSKRVDKAMYPNPDNKKPRGCYRGFFAHHDY
jgi:hypothetical protein